MSTRYYYGGQAVIEGVMMRGQHQLAVAVRQPDGRIALHSTPLDSWIYRSPIRNWPFIRGVFVLADALILGMKALTLSTNLALGPEAGAEPAATTAPQDAGGLAGPALWGTMATSLLFGIALFFVTPLLVTHFLDRWISTALLSNLVEGLLRLGILLGYLLLIGRVPEVRRVFGYHGAEHKTINAFEHGAPLEVATVQQQSTLHTRCGTGFLLIVVLFSVILFIFLGRPPLPLRILSRIVLVPAIAAIAYEYLRFTAAHYSNWLIRLLVAPSLALQHLTTREPDDGMIETAIVALKQVLVADGVLDAGSFDNRDLLLVDANGFPLPPPRAPIALT